ncbi:alpha-amylase [Streptomyces cavernicola]|uniref:Alpha-amylase n=1 Tax=Streptomyces cavernicola TaxID=3043613 RepID=A0ABT6S6Y9_9ACTN|nr:alpha-amylase family protein [Streptomyces sp. B-S-A6]MDI3403843.1 alpha-amylase family protein [Streptomyces sp. B-S-A6]
MSKLSRSLVAAAAAGSAALLGAAVLQPANASPAPDDATAAAKKKPKASAAAGKDVIANLWSWNWKSVAGECTDVLGPSGYAAVWVAPPHESIAHPDGNWWDIYQPVNYELNSRFGDKAAFAAMTKACNDAGVKVYTDAVVNHTAALTGTGYGGTQVTDKYQPAMYQRGDYNVDVCNRTISNWSDKWEVQNCELLGLPDLKTGSDAVRSKIAGYLNSQIALGVSGFRIDASKHIPAADLEAIVGKLDTTGDGSRPYVFHEVFPGPTPPPDEYYGSGKVLDFSAADRLKSAFQGDIASLKDFGNGQLPADKSVSFVTNHDTEREGRHLSYKDGDTAVLANVFQLGWIHADPAVYAGFTYENKDASPPANGDGFVTDTDCGNGAWYCLDRDPRVTGMVGWRAAVGDTDVSDFQSPQGNVIGFGRGAKGFVAVNNSGGAVTAEFSTQVPDGTYRDVLSGDAAREVTVSGGKAKIELPAKSAVAFHPGNG